MKKPEVAIIISIAAIVGLGLIYVFSGETIEDRLINQSDFYPDYVEIENPSGFINSEEFQIADYIGEKIILIDFMTYTCVNCQRTFPYLNSWYEKYEDDGLIIIGIHTPEFAFEKNIDNVQKALDGFGIKFPVVLDNDYSTWRAFENKYWPRKYLINKDGKIVYDHIGEGAYDKTEAKIVELLGELNNSDIEMEEGEVVGVQNVNFSKIGTRETYLGSSRIEYINNLPNRNCFGQICNYVKPENIPSNTYSLVGDWKIDSEESILEGESGSIFIKFTAAKVNLVAGGNVSAEIYLDGELVSSGADVQNGIVNFSDTTLYNLIDLGDEYTEHLLEIRSNVKGLEAFAFTFG